MNPLAYFAIALNRQEQREAERAILLRRKRVGDDEPAALVRDRRWAAAIHRFAVRSPESPATEVRSLRAQALDCPST